MSDHGQRLPSPARQRHTGAVEAVLPDQADELRSERGFAALLATLDQARCAGHAPEALLQRAVAQRELNTADSVTDLLVWRLRRLGNVPAHAPRPPTTKTIQQQARTDRPRTATPARIPAQPEPRHRR
ncbi:hypothetical protein [Streptomyces sp. NRRL S-1868]|uniref:hypothetical protein n=1 Tax=Streptomyces sp. NRRL S-1868 TaxID=1463892 RepID=UPI000B0DD49B